MPDGTARATTPSSSLLVYSWQPLRDVVAQRQEQLPHRGRALDVLGQRPLASHRLLDPLALDASFQAMILWSFSQRDMGSLPTGFDSYRQFCAAFPKEPVRIDRPIRVNSW